MNSDFGPCACLNRSTTWRFVNSLRVVGSLRRPHGMTQRWPALCLCWGFRVSVLSAPASHAAGSSLAATVAKRAWFTQRQRWNVCGAYYGKLGYGLKLPAQWFCRYCLDAHDLSAVGWRVSKLLVVYVCGRTVLGRFAAALRSVPQ